MNKLLENIEEIRKAKHIKQSYMAQSLGISQSAYSLYIARDSDITYSKLLQVSKVLETSVIDIITYPDKYVPLSSISNDCEECKEKDKIIKNLNDYIELLKYKLEHKK